MKTGSVDYIRHLLASGKYVFTRKDFCMAINRSGSALNKILERLKASGWIWPLGDDFFTIVDPAHQGLGCIPVYWFVDAWAKFKGVEYYIGGLSAAAFHGASHQQIQSVQIVVNRGIPPFRLPTQRVLFLYRKNISDSMWETRKVPTGIMRVSTPEVTAYDLLTLRKACSSLDWVATVFVEMGEAMRARSLASLAETGCGTAGLQRLGWMLDHTGWGRLTDGLARKLRTRRMDWQPLLKGRPAEGARDERWRIIENTDIQPFKFDEAFDLIENEILPGL